MNFSSFLINSVEIGVPIKTLFVPSFFSKMKALLSIRSKVTGAVYVTVTRRIESLSVESLLPVFSNCQSKYARSPSIEAFNSLVLKRVTAPGVGEGEGVGLGVGEGLGEGEGEGVGVDVGVGVGASVIIEASEVGAESVTKVETVGCDW